MWKLYLMNKYVIVSTQKWGLAKRNWSTVFINFVHYMSFYCWFDLELEMEWFWSRSVHCCTLFCFILGWWAGYAQEKLEGLGWSHTAGRKYENNSGQHLDINSLYSSDTVYQRIVKLSLKAIASYFIAQIYLNITKLNWYNPVTLPDDAQNLNETNGMGTLS